MRILIVAALVVTVVGGAWWLAVSADREAPPGSADDDAQTAERRLIEAPLEPAAPAALPRAEEPLFRERLRTFLAEASELSEARRDAEAEALRRDTLAREADGSLLPAESAYIQLALLRATVNDQQLLRTESQALLARYGSASEQGWEEYRRRSDPRHEAYREAETELIRRAQEDELSDAELRERLQALREQHYE